jgi:hypothetical protein
MYRVIVRVVLLGKDGIMGLSRSLELPFPPYPGLQLCNLTPKPEETEMIVGVAWSPVEECFYADLEDWRLPDEGIAGLIDHFGPGWELNEPGRVYEGAE